MVFRLREFACDLLNGSSGVWFYTWGFIPVNGLINNNLYYTCKECVIMLNRHSKINTNEKLKKGHSSAAYVISQLFIVVASKSAREFTFIWEFTRVNWHLGVWSVIINAAEIVVLKHIWEYTQAKNLSNAISNYKCIKS